jgi:transposase InsO family protein
VRRKSTKIEQKNQFFLERVKDLKSDHPLWGYRRVWAYMKFREGLPVNKKRIYRLMAENNLLVQKNRALRAKRCSSRAKPVADRPNQYFGTDMTKILIGPWGWLYLVVVLDWYTKEIVGYSLSMTSKTNDWLEALEMAVNKRFPNGIREADESVFLISDNGSQPTSTNYMKSCATLRIKQIFTTWNNPKGNADTERVMRTIKEDLVWTKEWDDPFKFIEALKKWVEDYNADFPHQSLNYLTPEQCMERFKNKEVALTNS